MHRAAIPFMRLRSHGASPATQARAGHCRCRLACPNWRWSGSTRSRPRHGAQAASVPDDQTAAVVETGARRAALRGAYDASAELFEAARRLTPAGRQEDLARRTLGQALAALKAGDVATARGLADSAGTG